MKKLLSIVGLALMASGLFAAEDIRTLIASKNYTGIVKQASELLETAKTNSNQGAKASVVQGIILARVCTGTYKTSAEGIADLDVMILGTGYTRNDLPWARIFIYERFQEYDKALAVPASDKSSQLRRAVVLAALKRYEEAADTAFKVGTPQAISAATKYIRLAKAPEKLYTYILTGFTTGSIKQPSEVKRLVAIILETDFSGTTVSDAKIKALLQTVNRRYSRLLKPGVVTAWDEVIQMVRQTLETY
ncbi:MAG: hypothetical protein IKB99_06150 [Lentisphaeria bacterium]|nr:hypothetical protein [Lentisphaeria bacterium]